MSLLPSVATNPVTGQTTINVKTANLRAVGIASPSTPDGFDGTISLNTTITSPGSPGSTLTYSLQAVVLHEIDEVLGLGSSLPDVTDGILPEDLYRYSSANTRSFTATDSRTSGVFAYFSIDATAALVEFDNQNDGGDFGDWQSNPRRTGVSPEVQDAFATPGANPLPGVELRALDVIGYDRVTGPPTAPPAVTGNPANVAVPPGAVATFTASASGAPTPTVQWQVSSGGAFTNVSGATSTTYAFVTSLTDSGKSFRAIFTNAVGSATTAPATLTVRRSATGDLDGDGRTDLVIWRPSTGTWFGLTSGVVTAMEPRSQDSGAAQPSVTSRSWPTSMATGSRT